MTGRFRPLARSLRPHGPVGRHANRRGYTLIEMVTIVALLLILTAVAWIRMRPAFSQAKVRGAANVIATDFRYAQLLSARYRQPVVVTIDPAAMAYRITDRSTTTVYRDRSFGPTTDYRLTTMTATPTTVQLLPSGIADRTITVTVGADGYDRHVTLTLGGQIRVLHGP